MAELWPLFPALGVDDPYRQSNRGEQTGPLLPPEQSRVPLMVPRGGTGHPSPQNTTDQGLGVRWQPLCWGDFHSCIWRGLFIPPGSTPEAVPTLCWGGYGKGVVQMKPRGLMQGALRVESYFLALFAASLVPGTEPGAHTGCSLPIQGMDTKPLRVK